MRSGLRQERTRNKMPTRKWKMAGSYLLYNELHYNGLMTDGVKGQYDCSESKNKMKIPCEGVWII